MKTRSLFTNFTPSTEEYLVFAPRNWAQAAVGSIVWLFRWLKKAKDSGDDALHSVCPQLFLLPFYNIPHFLKNDRNELTAGGCLQGTSWILFFRGFSMSSHEKSQTGFVSRTQTSCWSVYHGVMSRKSNVTSTGKPSQRHVSRTCHVQNICRTREQYMSRAAYVRTVHVT